RASIDDFTEHLFLRQYTRSLYPKKSGTIESTQRLPDETEAVISAAIEKIYRKKAASVLFLNKPATG
ncbi:hypothetical protein RYB35_27895, partial [Pseudomonas syringae pv. actinidiae]|nr:hypothetical protein [Pseudomonas syringae pv. actinidiae]MDU8556901.1 hypothetical protein [Pseudomonas syringae pv. actinidiae]MDU8570548.1 hypothetical protein [Pseudomonas syringae pv. actinidiae]